MRRLTIFVAIALSGCAEGEPTVTFRESSCHYQPTNDRRERRVQSTCALYSGSYKPGQARICMMWNHRTAHERKDILVCARDEWHEVRQ
jgi:hypothetical protein